MNIALWVALIYLIIGIGMVLWDFRGRIAFHEPPRFISDRSISTAIVFILIWPYKLLTRLFR